MGKQKSDILSGMGSGFQILKALRDAGATDEDLRRIIAENSPLPKQIVDLIVMKPATPTDPIFKVEVDYGKTLEAMIAAGRYDWTNDDITSERFPISGEGKALRELVLVHPNKVASTDEVLAELDRRGLRPAKIEELLALGVLRPELQKEFPIVALGSRFVTQDGDRDFACLGWDDRGRTLSLSWDGLDWSEIDRFLAVRK